MYELHRIRPGMSAFEIYLRTGLIVSENWEEAAAETKFNQRHYPENGRFARTGEGVLYGPGYGGFGGGGQGFDGGGASGSWPAPKPRPNAKPAQPKPTPPPVQTPATLPSAPSPTAVNPPRREIIKNNYRFLVDERERSHEVSGQLQSTGTARRSRTNQRQAGGNDRRHSDEGGHFIAVRFNGPREKFNHFAQNANFNRSAYKAMENQWANSVSRGHRVLVTISAVYEDQSTRPSRLTVSWNDNGRIGSKSFANEPGGRRP